MAYIGKSPDGTGVRSRFYYTQSSGGGTSVSGSSDDGTSLAFSDGAYVDVFLNGVLLVAGLAALANGDVVEVVVYDIFTVADTVSASQGGTFNASVTIANDLTVDTNTLKVDSSNNRVGIGTSTPTAKVHSVSTGAVPSFLAEGGTADFAAPDGENMQFSHHDTSAGTSTERMRIDTNGNLLVAKTALDNSTVGARFNATGDASFVADDNRPLVLNRKTSDGDLIVFLKDGSDVGSIGSHSGGGIFVSDNTVGFRFDDNGTDNILPCNGSGATQDNSIDLGVASARFDDIFATNTSIQTSDQNEKEQIASLTTAEITAAKAISKLFKTFKWQDKVASKGDAARTHAGIIAQEVQTAMSDAGLDASNYAFWCSDTWTNDDGNEQTRLGIRYAELLAFIGAATEQRLADLETRVTALEDA